MTLGQLQDQFPLPDSPFFVYSADQLYTNEEEEKKNIVKNIIAPQG